MDIVFATGNKNKMREIREIMEGFEGQILSMKEAGLNLDIVEDGDTFEANALIKARAVFGALKEKGQAALVLADDSGLEIDALGGRPGVYSARFMEEAPYEVRCQALIESLKDTPKDKRTARFRCVIAAVFPDGSEVTTSGAVEGYIAFEAAGSNGFGYDPILFYPPCGLTLAELTEEQKNEISHRGLALRKMRDIIREKI